MVDVVALGLRSALMLLQPVQVDFKIDSFSPPVATTAVSAASPGYGQPLVLDAPVAPPPAVVRPLLARGFGRDVPLAFAIRQIVPATLHVQYSDSIDQDVRVSWTGGLPWRKVLQNTISPLGIHAAQSGSTVRVTE